MKTKVIILSLVSLSLTVLSARASSSAEQSNPIRLPAFIVEAPRLTSAEKAIDRNLDALRVIATKPIAIKVTLPMPEAKNLPAEPEQKTAAKVVVVAGI